MQGISCSDTLHLGRDRASKRWLYADSKRSALSMYSSSSSSAVP